MKGRKPKPTALHQLHGTFNATRHGRDRACEPQPQGDLTQPPETLTDSERASWDYVISHAPKGLLKKIDRAVLIRWVKVEDRLMVAEAAQRELDCRSAGLPFLVRGPNGLEISPYVKIIERETVNLIRLSDRLGFSPVARPRIQIEPSKTDDESGDTWGQLKHFPIINSGRTAG